MGMGLQHWYSLAEVQCQGKKKKKEVCISLFDQHNILIIWAVQLVGQMDWSYLSNTLPQTLVIFIWLLDKFDNYSQWSKEKSKQGKLGSLSGNNPPHQVMNSCIVSMAAYIVCIIKASASIVSTAKWMVKSINQTLSLSSKNSKTAQNSLIIIPTHVIIQSSFSITLLVDRILIFTWILLPSTAKLNYPTLHISAELLNETYLQQ